MLGVGVMYSSLERMVHLVSPAKRESVLKVLSEHEPEEVDYEHALFACVKCNTLQSRFNYRLVYDHGHVVEPRFRCGDCRAKLVPAAEDIGQYSCRRFGARPLTIEQEMLWD